jgi:hypothetical protein
MRRLCQLLLLVSLSGLARGEDSVRIIYRSAISSMPSALVESRLSIVRQPLDWDFPSGVARTDRFFSSVERLIGDARTPEEWGDPGLHQPWVVVEIKLNDRSYRLISAIGVNGPTLWLNASDADKRQFSVLKSVVSLAQEHQRSLLKGVQ